MVPGYDDIDNPSLLAVCDSQQQLLSSSISADSADQTSGVDSPGQNQDASHPYSSIHTGTGMQTSIYSSGRALGIWHGSQHKYL